jgi:hypothetical protein
MRVALAGVLVIATAPERGEWAMNRSRCQQKNPASQKFRESSCRGRQRTLCGPAGGDRTAETLLHAALTALLVPDSVP